MSWTIYWSNYLFERDVIDRNRKKRCFYIKEYLNNLNNFINIG